MNALDWDTLAPDDLVLPLHSQKATLATVGGKGANLSQLVQAGFPVPAGFLVSTAAYRAFVQDNELQSQIVALASSGAATDFEAASAAIRQLFERGSISSTVEIAIQQAYAALGPHEEAPIPLAVRSSATAEDLPGASFAGQQETYLNVRGEQALLQAVQRCWSSLWTARTLAYRAGLGIDPATVSLAVVVQVLVQADASGVLFTANPLTGARDEIVIDAAWGLGEAIVSGLVTPDHLMADKATGTLKQVEVADKTVMTAPTATGTEERPVEVDRRRAQVLDEAQVAQLVRLGGAIEAHYHTPQDIEWCLAGDEFWIVQSRPITTLPPEPMRWESPVPGAKWFKDLQAAEWATEPLSPLGATTTFATMVAARQGKLPDQRLPWSVLVNGWLYLRADFQVLSFAVHLVGIVLMSIPAGRLNGHRRVRRTWPKQLTLLDQLARTDPSQLSDTSLQAHVDRLLTALGWWWWEVSWDAAVAVVGEQLIGKLGVPNLANPAVLFRGNDSLLLEAERALRQAVTTGSVEAYLARFGHFMESADPIHPTLRELPELLAQYLAVARQSEMGPDERLRRTRSARAEAEALVRALRGPRGRLSRWVLGVGQGYAAHVDDAVFHFQRVLSLLRATFLEVGQRLARRGAVERAEDVFYLEQAELWAPPVDLATRVTQRRLLRESHKRLAPPPFIPPLSDPAWAKDLQLDKQVFSMMMFGRGAQERDGRRVLVGTPGSPGRARGTARIIAGPGDFPRFQPGDVLVAHTTSPIWTPLFSIASAAVTEVGGPMSHAAIVAREFGIPLVNGALDATQVIVDGMSVVVDGSAGIVEL
jgi:phosphohistidine swiveling domain-containing protein